jgi:predicted dehydrogenase
MNEKRANNKINRRDFLHSAAAASAGLALPQGTFAKAKGGKKPDDIYVALLGAGSQGQVLLNACKRIPGVRFKAVCDIWAEWNRKRVSRILKAYRHEHNTYTDYREMLAAEKDLDAVIIATPDFWHSPQTVACLEAGLHVYCETAMSNTIDGAGEMVEAARRTGKLLQIGCQRRSNPRYLHCYDKLLKDNRFLGRITGVSGQWNRMVRGPLGWPEKYAIDRATLEKYGYESMHQFRNWRWCKGLGGGPVVDRGSHQIDVFNWFLGANPRSVMANGRTAYLDKNTHEWYDTVMVVFEYETEQGPVLAHYQILSNNRNEGYFEKFLGNRGTLTISQAAYLTKIHPELMNSEYADWARFVKEGRLNGPEEVMKEIEQEIDKLTIPQLVKLLTVHETPPGRRFRKLSLPVKMTKPYHQPHLENFFDAIRGKAELNCPAEIGYETAVAVLKVNGAIEAERKLFFNPENFVVPDPQREMIEHFLEVKLPEAARNCRYHYKSYGMGSGITWGFFEIPRADLPALMDASDCLPDTSELGQNPVARENIENYIERPGENIPWWKPLTLKKRRYASKALESLGPVWGRQMDICVGEIRDDLMGVYIVYHCD